MTLKTEVFPEKGFNVDLLNGDFGIVLFNNISITISFNPDNFNIIFQNSYKKQTRFITLWYGEVRE